MKENNSNSTLLTKHESHDYESLVASLLDILINSLEKDFENLIIQFIKEVITEKADKKLRLRNFLNILRSNSFLLFMVEIRISQISYRGRIRILSFMEQIWMEEIEIINKLSHLAYVSHLWKKCYGISPFSSLMPSKFLIDGLINDSADQDGLGFELMLPKPTDSDSFFLKNSIKKIEVFT